MRPSRICDRAFSPLVASVELAATVEQSFRDRKYNTGSMSLNLTTDLPDNSTVAQASSGIYIFAAIVLGFIGFFGFILNLLVILTVVKNANVLWTPNNVVLVNMAIGDLLVAVLGNPIAMVSAIAGMWYWSYNMCQWYAWFMTTMGFASIGNLTVMAFERFLLVIHPMRTLSIKHAYILTFLIWIYALSLSLPPFFNWGKYGWEACNISCSVSWEQHDPEMHNDTYIGFLFIFGFFAPVMIIISSYYSIIRTLRNISRRVRRNNKRETKITKMVLLMIIAFLIAWMPYAVLALAIQYFYVEISSNVVSVLPALLAKSSICYNPVIYTSLNIQFFHAWKKMFFGNVENPKKSNKDSTKMITVNKIEMKTLNCM
ncbi:PREDICTED: rhodopsin-like [Dinoponera quadriceps]|uniref:Rhodopsin-like n=1 Tax=Dinoponera quadriceps TaxID=609295 RepID=A0A6P3XF49_DINQU|nr:PREDICTED: rhodopsin-like [Dinoponera quadriceps]